MDSYALQHQRAGIALPALPAHPIFAHRIARWSIPFDLPRPDGELERARLACLRTISDLLTMFDPDTTSLEMRNTLEMLRSHLSQPFKNRRELQQNIVLTAGILDIFVLDEMAPDEHDWIFRTTYGRHDGILFGDVTSLVLSRREASIVVHALERKGHAGLDWTDDIAQHPNETTFYLRHPVHHRRLQEVYRSLREISEGRTSSIEITFGVDFGDVVLFLQRRYTPPKPDDDSIRDSWAEIPADYILPPSTSLPRQDLWRTMLAHGISLISEPAKSEAQKATVPTSAEGIFRSMHRTLATHPEQRTIRRRMARLEILVRHAGNAEAAAHFETNHVRHYERILAVEGTRPHVLLTRSGISANEVAIDAVAKLAGKGAPAYMHRGWYYENERSILTHFSRRHFLENATCCFVNLLPCYPERFMRMDTGKSIDEPQYFTPMQVIQLFLEKADWQRNKQHYLVIDKTSDLLFALPASAVPANVTLIETASLTKHQRGARNYFYGLATSRGDDNVRGARSGEGAQHRKPHAIRHCQPSPLDRSGNPRATKPFSGSASCVCGKLRCCAGSLAGGVPRATGDTRQLRLHRPPHRRGPSATG
jgi:hypothetical protein